MPAFITLPGDAARTRRRHRTLSIVAVLFAACGGLAAAPAGAADAVERWNAAMTDWSAAQPPPGLPPFVEARAYAMAHLAILDATRAALQRAGGNRASAAAAIAAAARNVLAVELGKFGDATAFDALYAAELAAVPDGPAEDRGVAIGRAAAAAMLASRADENVYAALGAPYTPGTAAGEYQPTPPTNVVAGAGWAALRPFAVRDAAQFRAPAPYRLKSLQYALDLNEIRAFGAAGAAARSPDQTAIAFYWYENSSFAWNRIARQVAGALSLAEHARLYAALNVAISDAYTTSLESKFHYRFWRPLTAIRAAAADGNPLTAADPAWEPAFVTPPVPDYPSAHAAAGGAAAEVLMAFVGAVPFTHVSTTGPISGVDGAATRSFADALDAARENAYSRLLVGIHFRLACTAGLHQGREVGRYVLTRAPFGRH